MRRMLVPLIAAGALLVPAAAAQAQSPGDAGSAASSWLNRNGERLSGDQTGGDRERGRDRDRRVSISDVNVSCLQHPIIASRFGCVFTLRVAVTERDRDRDRSHYRARASRTDPDGRDRDRRDRRDRDRGRDRPDRERTTNYGCLGALRVNFAGPGVSVTPAFVDCVRVRSND